MSQALPTLAFPPCCRAISAGFADAGVGLITNYPGFHSHEIETPPTAVRPITSIDEKTAFSVAWGASLGGIRSAVTLKNVGLNAAADPFLNSLRLDTNAGLIVAVFDDTDVEQSQIRQDSRFYHFAAGGLWLEPSTLAQAREFAAMAFDLSERFSSPVVLRITNQLLSLEGEVPASTPLPERRRPFVRRPEGFVVHPSLHAIHQRRLEEKRQLWAAFSESFHAAALALSRPHSPLHLVAGSAPLPQGLVEDEVIRLVCLPLPGTGIRQAVANASRVTVHEHGDPVVAGCIERLLSGQIVEFRSAGCARPNRHYHCADRWEPLFAILRNLPDRIVIGDLGGFTMDPARSIDACLSYGASVAVATGVALACPEIPVIAVTGDGAFLHSGKTALAEAITRQVNLLVILLDNGGCRSTGGQPLPGHLTGLDHGCPLSEVDWLATSPETLSATVRELASRRGVHLLKLHIPF